MTGCVVSVGQPAFVAGSSVPVGSFAPSPAGPTGPTGPVGVTGSTGPAWQTVLDLDFRKDPEHHLEVRLFGSPRRILQMAVGWLRGKGHVWQVTGRSMVCDRCLASVHVDPPSQAHFRRSKGRRRLVQRRYPDALDIRSVRGHFPHCFDLRERLVQSVADR